MRSATLVTRINSFNAGVTASTIFDGDSYRLSLSVDQTGAGNEMLVDGLAADLEFEEFSSAQDAVIELGGTTPGSGVVVTSSTNTFDNVISGLDVTIVEPSDKTITVDVTSSSTALLDVAQDFVDAYNSIRTFLDDTTSFDPDALTTGILFGTQAALRVDSDLSNVVTGRFFGVGTVYVARSGRHSASTTRASCRSIRRSFKRRTTRTPAALTKLFTDKSLGVSAKLKTVIDRLVGSSSSALSARSATLADTIEKNTERVEVLDARLTRQRERLFNQFTALETTIATLQQNLSALSSLQIIPPLSISRNNNN